MVKKGSNHSAESIAKENDCMAKTKSLVCLICLLIAVNEPALAQYWTSQSSSTTATLSSVKAVNATTVWVCGSSGTVLRTSDGGSTWITRSIPNAATQSCESIDAFDANTASVVAYTAGTPTSTSATYKTTDGGGSWTVQYSSSATGNYFDAIRYYDALTGLMVGDPEGGYFHIATTTNGGTTWTRTASATIPAPKTTSFGSEYSITNNLAIFGTNAWFGTSGVADSLNIIPRVYRSADRGKTWSVSSNISGLGGGGINTTSFGSATVGFVGGANGKIARTTDGGVTWVAPLATGLRSISGSCFVNSSIAVVVGSGGSNCCVSKDGGVTWTAQAPPGTGTVYAVSFASASVGWAVGASGAIYKWIGGNLAGGPLTETEPNNTSSQANSIALKDSINASVNPAGDVDYYKFTASIGDTLEFYLYNINASLLASQIRLYDASGNQLIDSYHYVLGTDSRMVHAFSASGTYYLRVAEEFSAGTFPNSVGGQATPDRVQVDQPSKKIGTLMDPTGEYRIRMTRFVRSAPVATNGSAVSAYSDQAMIWVSVVTNALPTTISVQYGLTTSYGSTAVWGTSTVGDIGYWGYPTTLTGLAPNTLYHGRCVATNLAGTSYSPDFTFSTAPAPSGWTRQSVSTLEYLWAVQFSDALNGTAVGSTGTIVRTTNGGTNWTFQTSGSTNMLRAVHFVNSTIGTIVGSGGLILRTTNGGTSWTTQTSGTTNTLYDVHFFDANNGVLVGSGGLILQTANGGATWVTRTSGTTNALRAVSFSSSTAGTVVGSAGTILRTTDGGVSWTSQTGGGSGILNGVSCVDASTIYCTGFDGVILKSTNGGSTWVNQNSGSTTIYLYSCSFSDVNNGVAAGGDGLILKTTNGGSSWISQLTGTFNWFYGVANAGGSYVAVGDYGLILRSATSSAAAIALSSTSFPFGNVAQGSSGQQTLTVSNPGGSTLTVTSISSSNTAFTVNPSTLSVPAGGSLPVTITFAPSAATTYSATITLVHNATGSPSTVSVSGTGTSTSAPVASISATSLAFGNVTVGTPTQKTFTVGNVGNAALIVTNISTGNSAFAVSPSAFQVSAGAGAQTITVTFTPAAAQSYSATITVTHNAAGSPGSVAVTGSGTSSGSGIISAQVSTVSCGTVKIGGSGQQSFQVTNSGTVAVTVTNVSSSNAMFTVSPSSFTLIAGGSQNITVTFTPTSTGTQSSTLTFASNAATSPTITATGIGEAARVIYGSTSVGRFSGGIPSSTWVLISVPYTLDDPSASALANQLSGSTPWKLYTYQNGQTVEITNASDAFKLFRGVWFKTTAKTGTFNLVFQAGDLVGGSTISATVPTGWSLVGPPFLGEEASWFPVNTTAGSSGIRVYKYAHEQSRWVLLDPAIEKMKPFGGYAVYNATGSTTQLNFVRGGAATKIDEWQSSGDGWYAGLDVGESSLRIGQHRLAQDGMDVYDYPMPPARPESESDDPYVSNKLWSDIRPLSSKGLTTWSVFVDPQVTRSIKPTGLANFPSDWRIVVQGIPFLGLKDFSSGESIRIPDDVNSSFRFTILAGPRELVEQAILPSECALSQNYPNPFNPSTAISYQLSASSTATLKVFDLLGREIVTLVDAPQNAGYYTVIWGGHDAYGKRMASGVYFYRLQTDRYIAIRRMMLLQ